MNQPIELSYKELPLDPYILGLWFGDGTSEMPSFTVHKDDIEMYDCMKPIYGQYKVYVDKRNSNVYQISYTGEHSQDNSLLRHQLVELNLLGNKHIPSEYLRASKDQR